MLSPEQDDATIHLKDNAYYWPTYKYKKESKHETDCALQQGTPSPKRNKNC